MIIEIFPDDVSKLCRTASDKNFFYQKAYLHKSGSKFPIEFQISLEQNQQPFQAGRYTVGDDSYRISKYSKLELDPFRLTLTPVVQPAAVAPAGVPKSAV